MKTIGEFRMFQNQLFRVVVFHGNQREVLADIEPYQLPEISHIAELVGMTYVVTREIPPVEAHDVGQEPAFRYVGIAVFRSA